MTWTNSGLPDQKLSEFSPVLCVHMVLTACCCRLLCGWAADLCWPSWAEPCSRPHSCWQATHWEQVWWGLGHL